jgi:glucokinase
LLADVGGTNVRFAVLGRAGLGSVAHLAVNDYQNFADGLAAFMALQPNSTAIRYAVFGVAGVVEDWRCALTNNAWLVDTAQLRARFGFAGSHIVKEAVAWSLPLLAASELSMIGGLENLYQAISSPLA